MFNFFKKKASSPPSSPSPSVASLQGIDLYLKDIPDAIERADDGIPRVNWQKVGEAVRFYEDHPGIDQLWTEMAAQWLGVLRRYLNEEEASPLSYRLYEGKYLLLLSAADPRRATDLLKIGDTAYQRLEELVQCPPQERGLGKHAVIVLADQKTYYDYISHYYPDTAETFGTSGGIHISEGYRHTVINSVLRDNERTLVHELAHDMLYGRDVPMWLNEGLAQWAEGMVHSNRGGVGGSGYFFDARRVRVYRRYWSWKGTGSFWSGQSFYLAASQRASYQLAEVMFRNLLGHPHRSRRLSEFLATATHHDAGDAACRACFGCPLSSLAEEFLGPGSWQPAT